MFTSHPSRRKSIHSLRYPSQFGEAVPYGYQLCDKLLGKAMAMIGDDTVLVLASSMGRQPLISERYVEGKYVVRIKNIDKVLELIGHDGITDVVPTMVPQWNLTIPDATRRAQVKVVFEAAVRRQAGAPDSAFAVQEMHDQWTITPLGLARNHGPIEYEFTLPDGKRTVRPLGELFEMDAPTVKQGMHHIDGMLALWGTQVQAGKLAPCTNLDVAPTILALLDVPIPAAMHGQVMPALRAGQVFRTYQQRVGKEAALSSA